MDEDAAHAADTLEVPFLAPKAPKPVAVHSELRDLFALTAAVFVASVSWVAMKTTDTALLGHVGTNALSAASLSDIWTMASGVFIQGRVLGIFVGNAVGAAKAGTAPWSVAGEWFQVSIAVLGAIALVVMGLWALTEPVLTLFGEEPSLVSDASFFSLVLMACIPARVLFSQLSQYFSAQGIVKPSMQVALIGLAANLSLGFVFVLGVPFEDFSTNTSSAQGAPP